MSDRRSAADVNVDMVFSKLMVKLTEVIGSIAGMGYCETTLATGISGALERSMSQ